ncbi:hypothetical protein [Ligilactobacillus cholophilus]|uniref:hypothetical protein n=1 Tax=Ligilactobacillus cholophilus TaxID=3050131 RepID=UPI0025B213AA|nr:hypothetical protein [Ligilactobacillus cholophilus]
MIKKIFKNYGHYIYLYIFSCFALLLCSHFSPLYKYNFSEDPSIYLTIGRGIMHGLIPYKDLLDIKGPIIFFLYAIFSPIKIGTNYFGIFILETIALWISVTFIYKTILLVSKSKNWSLILTLIYPFILLNYDSFMNGGEAEEFILSFIFILIYLTFKIINNNYKATKKQYLFLGFSVGFVFWIKYTCLGAWLAFYLCNFFILIKQKDYIEIKKMIYYSLLGFMFPTAFVFGYFLINHAFNDLVWGYFGWNYLYGGLSNETFLKHLFFIISHSLVPFLRQNIIIWLLVILIPYILIFSSSLVKQTNAKLVLLSMIFCNMAVETIAGIMYSYYQLLAIPFVVLSLSWLAIKLKDYRIKTSFLIPIVSFFTFLGIITENPSIFNSNLFGYTPYQVRFANLMKKNPKNVSVLDFNELDSGWYNYLGIMPPTKYFNKMNMHHDGEYRPFINAQLNIIKKRKVKYVICIDSNYKNANKWNKVVYKNYRLIDEQKINDQYINKYLLLERK